MVENKNNYNLTAYKNIRKEKYYSVCHKLINMRNIS